MPDPLNIPSPSPGGPQCQGRRRLCGLLLGALPGLALAQATKLPATVEAKAEAEAFRIGPGDVLSVQVWKQPALSLQLPVLPDGSLRYPLAGELQVQGRTVAEVERLLTERLGATLREAVVSVSVSQVNSQRIYLLGEVLRPGEYPLRGPITLVQALAMASGLTPFARRESILILRSHEGVQSRQVFNLEAYLHDPTVVDPPLLPGDTVVVR